MRNVRLLYLFQFFSHLIPAYVIERLFWEQRGMTVPMVVYTEMIYAVTIVLLEVPTGVLADRKGRKPMIVLAAIFGCVEFLLLVFAHSFWHFALVVFLTAIGNAAASGAENAMLYDSLKASGREREFEKILGRMNALDVAAVVVAALTGSWLAGKFGFELDYWLSLGAATVALAVSLLLTEPPGIREPSDQPLPIVSYTAASLRFFREHPSVGFVLLSAMATGAAVNFVDEFWQLYLEKLEVPVALFGAFSASIYALRLPGSLIAYRLKERVSFRGLLAVMIGAIAIGFLGITVAGPYVGLASLGVIFLASGVIEPLASGYLHHRTDSGIRATLDSFQSLGSNAALVATGAGFGCFSADAGLLGGFGFLAAGLAAFLVYFLFATRRGIEA